jgi:putative ATP-dependent endonuclease of OLD family
MEGHDASDWTEGSPDEPRKLLGIAKKADHMLRTSDVVQKAQDDLNRLHLNEFSIGDTPLTGKIEPSGQELRHILERLELSLSDAESNRCRGLGIHNLLFMATELLALAPNEDADLPLLLIEEPEAHLHPQYQQRLIDYIRQRAKRTRDDGRDKLQILLTTHSPQFAAHVPLNGITLVHTGTTFSLRREEAKLDSSDYEFLERFLDVTKANLFFARGVIVVEGDAEALLLPVLARKLGRPLEKYGVSIVNVGHTGLFRYSRILQRQAGPELPVRVACICDRDIPPLAAVKLVKEGRKTEDKYQPAEVTDKINLLSQNDAQNVKTFVSPHWTFEHDLARGGLARLVHRAISVARKSRLLRQFPVGRDYDERLREADESFRNWKLLNWSEERIAVEIYTPLSKNRASKAEVAQALAMMLDKLPDQYVARRLPGYIIDAITYATSGP